MLISHRNRCKRRHRDPFKNIHTYFHFPTKYHKLVCVLRSSLFLSSPPIFCLYSSSNGLHAVAMPTNESGGSSGGCPMAAKRLDATQQSPELTAIVIAELRDAYAIKYRKEKQPKQKSASSHQVGIYGGQITRISYYCLCGGENVLSKNKCLLYVCCHSHHLLRVICKQQIFANIRNLGFQFCASNRNIFVFTTYFKWLKYYITFNNRTNTRPASSAVASSMFRSTN